MSSKSPVISSESKVLVPIHGYIEVNKSKSQNHHRLIFPPRYATYREQRDVC